MTKRTPIIPTAVADSLVELGRQIRQHRKTMRISVTVAAEAAGMSRDTFHRIERGEPSVTMGGYLNAMAALGLDFGIIEKEQASRPEVDLAGMIPARIYLDDYPQLRKLAWQVHGTDALTPVEALSVYERNWRYVDEAMLEPGEQQLIDALRLGLGGGNAAV